MFSILLSLAQIFFYFVYGYSWVCHRLRKPPLKQFWIHTGRGVMLKIKKRATLFFKQKCKFTTELIQMTVLKFSAHKQSFFDGVFTLNNLTINILPL